MARDPLGREKARNAQIIELCRIGLTVRQIAEQYGLRREHIRQIAARAGVVANERPRTARTIAERKSPRQKKHPYPEQRKVSRDQWANMRYGCDHKTVIAINGTRRTKQPGCPAMAYIGQVRNAAARGIPFRLTFPQWMQVWEESGNFADRGRGVGKYCMSRFQDRGAYEVGNVYIQLATANSSEAIKRTLANGRMPWQRKAA